MTPVRSQRECPVCLGKDVELRFRQQFTKIDGGASLLSGYDVVTCARCGCAFADGLPPQSAFDAYYRDFSKYDHAATAGEESEFARTRFDAIAGVLARALPHDARVLEIGCSTGGLLGALQKRGFSRLRGIDPSRYSAEAVTRLHGIEATVGTLAEPGVSGPFDVVMLVHVLEHLRDLSPALETVRNLLTPDGRIYIDVPDATGFARWLDAPFQQFSVEHIGFFTPSSLTNLLTMNGFAKELVEKWDRPESPTSVMPSIAALFRRSGGAASFARETESAEAIEGYIAASRTLEKKVHAVIDALVDSKRPVVVWGVGTHTARLLETSRLGDARIVSFVDSNPRYHGNELRGIRIEPPSALKDRRDAVLISSRVFEREIARVIRDDMKLDNEIILIYEETACA